MTPDNGPHAGAIQHLIGLIRACDYPSRQKPEGKVAPLNFFKELQRRNVFRVAIGYIVSCWLLVQVADIVLETIGAPAWVMQTIMLVLALGFPVVVFFSWAYEVTPEGIKHQSEVDRQQSITHVTGRKLDRAILVVLTISLGYFIWEARFADRPDVAPPEAASSAERQTIESDSDRGESKADENKSIAVLPFDNRSNREEDQFFTDGIHDDLLTTLARIGSMKVISRTSVMEYRETTKKIPQIAAELGVAHILEGAIQRSGNQVRINVQLIDAKTDEHLWAEIYDRELTAENLFAIQSEISTQIAAALQTTLSDDEKKRVNRMPTDNLDAYDAYLRGKQLMATRVTTDLAVARDEFLKAVELDPRFALAWVGVADSHYLYALYHDLPLSGTIAVREEAVKKALALDPTLGEAYASLGLIYQDRDQAEEMEQAFRKAIELSPNYATAYHWYSTAIIGDPLRSRERLGLILQAAELDPRSLIIGSSVANEYFHQGLFSRGEQQALKTIELGPDFPNPHHELVDHYIWGTAEYAKALEHARELERIDPGDFDALRHQMEVYLAVEDHESAERIQAKITDINPDTIWAGWRDLMTAWSKGNAPGMKESAHWFLQKAGEFDWALREVAGLFLAAGEPHRARELLLRADPGWAAQDQWESLIRSHPIDACIMAWILIDADEPDQGTALLRRTLKYLEEDLPAAIEHADRQGPDTCYLAAGETDKALASLETQLAHGHFHEWTFLHQLPMYAAIGHEPRYLAMLEERDRRVAEQRDLIDATSP
jgi:TolB-like protein